MEDLAKCSHRLQRSRSTFQMNAQRHYGSNFLPDEVTSRSRRGKLVPHTTCILYWVLF